MKLLCCLGCTQLLQTCSLFTQQWRVTKPPCVAFNGRHSCLPCVGYQPTNERGLLSIYSFRGGSHWSLDVWLFWAIVFVVFVRFREPLLVSIPVDSSIEWGCSPIIIVVGHRPYTALSVFFSHCRNHNYPACKCTLPYPTIPLTHHGTMFNCVKVIGTWFEQQATQYINFAW